MIEFAHFSHLFPKRYFILDFVVQPPSFLTPRLVIGTLALLRLP